jgi:hypothetical protein
MSSLVSSSWKGKLGRCRLIRSSSSPPPPSMISHEMIYKNTVYSKTRY